MAASKAAAEAAAGAYDTARTTAGAELLAARNVLNTADTAFSLAKSQSYKRLNEAQQSYKAALTA